MRTLDLNNFEVSEISFNESQNIAGGFWKKVAEFLIGHVAGKLLDAAIEDFNSRDGSKPASITDKTASFGPY